MNTKRFVYRKFATDDVFVPFPLSPHVLNLRRPPPKKVLSFFLRRKLTVVGMLLMFCISSVSLASAHMGSTLAYFRDDEQSHGNSFQAGSLGFSLESEGGGYTFEAGEEDAAFELTVITPDPDSLPAHYNVRAEKMGGSDALCGALHASATTSPFIYDGALTALDMEPPEPGRWQMDITLSSEAGLIAGDECAIDLVYKAWLDGAGPLGGYIQEDRVPLLFAYENAAAFSVAPLSVESVEEHEVPPPEEAALPPAEVEEEVTGVESGVETDAEVETETVTETETEEPAVEEEPELEIIEVPAEDTPDETETPAEESAEVAPEATPES